MARPNGRSQAVQGDSLFAEPVLGTALGRHFIDTLHSPNPENHPLKIGTDTFSRWEVIVELRCPHPIAPRILTRIADDIKAKNVRDFFNRTNPYMMASEPRSGKATLHTAFRLFAARGLDVNEWYGRGQADAMQSFDAIKARLHREEARLKEAEKKDRRKKSRAVHEQNVQTILKT